MKALSIRQPWAWLIVKGHKDIENRNWKTSFRGRVLIHSGKMFDGGAHWRDHFPQLAVCPDGMFLRGGIVGEMEIVDCVTESDSEWFEGTFGLVIRNAKPLPLRPLPGQLGFFDVSEI